MHIYVCSPSGPVGCTEADLEIARNYMTEFGHQVTYSKNMFNVSGNTAGSIAERVSDLHEGFTNPQYDMVMASNGGFNSNELLPYIDYSLIEANNKPFCGFSDNTTLCLNLYSKSHIRSVYGLCYSFLKFSQNRSELTHFNDALVANSKYYNELQSRILDGAKVLRHGLTKGKLIGGNLAVINWLIGTEYELEIPENSVLFLEDDDDSTGLYWQMYLRRFQMLGYFDKISGLIIGKTPFTEFNDNAGMKEILELVLSDYDFPIIYDSHFGHLRDNTINNIELGVEVEMEV